MSKKNTFFIAIFVCLLGAFLLARVSSPLENRQNNNRFIHDESDHHDDLAALMSAKNFYENGWLQNAATPNRKGVVTQDFWGIPCSRSETSSDQLTDEEVQRYTLIGPRGDNIVLSSAQKNCYYTHFPPLPDWFWGGVYQSGLRSFGSFKMIAILLHAISLFFVLRGLSKYFSLAPVLIGGVLFGTFIYQMNWASTLYNLPLGFFFFSLFFHEAATNPRPRWQITFYTIFLMGSSYEFILCPLALLFLYEKKEWKSAFFKISLGFIGFATLIYVQRALFFHDFLSPILDVQNSLSQRYQEWHFNFIGFYFYYLKAQIGTWWNLGLVFTLGIILFFHPERRKKLLPLFVGFLPLFLYLWPFFPRMAAHHLNRWLGFITLFWLLCYVNLIDYCLSVIRKKKSIFIAVSLLSFCSLLTLDQLIENASKIYRDSLLLKESWRNYDSKDLSKKPLTLFYTPLPTTLNTFLGHDSKHVLIDNLINQKTYDSNMRPSSIQIKENEGFLLNIHFIDIQNFSQIYLITNKAVSWKEASCEIQNLESGLSYKISPRFDDQQISLSFPHLKGKDFQLKCPKLSKLELYEMKIYE